VPGRSHTVGQGSWISDPLSMLSNLANSGLCQLTNLHLSVAAMTHEWQPELGLPWLSQAASSHLPLSEHVRILPTISCMLRCKLSITLACTQALKEYIAALQLLCDSQTEWDYKGGGGWQTGGYRRQWLIWTIQHLTLETCYEVDLSDWSVDLPASHSI